MIKAHVYDQNVLQLTYLLALQLTLMSLGGQLTLEVKHLNFLINSIYDNKKRKNSKN